MTQPRAGSGNAAARAATAPAAKPPNGAERLLRAAVEAGVEVCFANPGTISRINPWAGAEEVKRVMAASAVLLNPPAGHSPMLTTTATASLPELHCAGTSEMHFVSAIDSVGGLRPVLGIHETVCSGAAGGWQQAAVRRRRRLRRCNCCCSCRCTAFRMPRVFLKMHACITHIATRLQMAMGAWRAGLPSLSCIWGLAWPMRLPTCTMPAAPARRSSTSWVGTAGCLAAAWLHQRWIHQAFAAMMYTWQEWQASA